MVVGTTSHAGKSLVTTALCRLLAQQGYRVAPFKGQNMALNAYVTAEGKEMGHAQAVQAWAAKTEPLGAMNPILLKPQGDMTSQVILRGEAVGVTRASDYYQQYFQRGWQAITESLALLQKTFEVIVCEGAGSPAEINLKHRDLTNMRVASHLQAWTLLVVDIDRGGAFAHVVGTLALLEPEERALIKGIVINKFRGQRSLLDSGIEWLESYTGIPVLGVLPYSDIAFPAEDSLSLLERPSRPGPDDLRIGIIRLPRIANFTDFDPLTSEINVCTEFIGLEQSLGNLDAVILPGSKTTLADLQALHHSGMAQEIQAYAAQGGTVLGLCGGYQMLGEVVTDPSGQEGELRAVAGLKLLPLRTQLQGTKLTQQRQALAHYPVPGFRVTGYEIHQGLTEVDSSVPDFFPLFQDQDLGLVNAEQTCWGSYLHGLFDHGPWRRAWLNQLRQRRGLGLLPLVVDNYAQQREKILDQVAELLAQYLNLDPILSYLETKTP
ncbi:cobyric acid synthase [Synechocystis sp. LKSZ1]